LTTDETHWLFHLLYLAGFAISIGLTLRIVMLKRPAGVTFAWVMVVLVLPLLGSLVYLLIGETRLGEQRAGRAKAIHQLFQDWLTDLQGRARQQRVEIPDPLNQIQCQAVTVVGLPALGGNRLQLLDSYPSIFSSVIEDIDSARHTCHLQFYIWHGGGLADQVGEALMRARQRGVACRVLLDAVGSKPFLKGAKAEQLRRSGIELVAMLPVSPLRLFLRRADLRNHRKIIVIDYRVAYTGSQNLVDPRHFKQGEGVGEWIDVMIRVSGPLVEEMAGIFLEDWQLETGGHLEILDQHPAEDAFAPQGEVVAQAVPSGPVFRYMAIHQLLITTLYAARRELVVITPYFVPDDSLKMALISAAQRGVQVTLILPRRVDSLLVRYASRSMFDELLTAGVRIAQFKGGLLHTKAITVDRRFAIVGSVNMDMRSLWLNMEISLFVYDRAFTESLCRLTDSYLEDSEMLEYHRWKRRPLVKQMVENVTRLVGPLL